MRFINFQFHLTFGPRPRVATKVRSRQSLIASLRNETMRLRRQCSASTHNNRLTAINSLEHFLEDTSPRADRLTLAGITPDHIRAYQRWALDKGLRLNYVRCNLRNLRALINYIAPGIGQKLFCNIHTSNTQTDKRSASEQTIRHLTQMPLIKGSSEAQARDIFLFCMFMMGIPLIDAAFLRKSQMADGYITYYRRKTHRQVRVGVHPALQQVVRRLHTPDSSPYLLPILSETNPAGALRQYQCFLQKYNRRLALLSARLGMERRLTSYTARHTWASLAYKYGVSPNTISQALCHSNPRTTLTYISELTNSQLDQSNQLVIDKLLGEEKVTK